MKHTTYVVKFCMATTKTLPHDANPTAYIAAGCECGYLYSLFRHQVYVFESLNDAYQHAFSHRVYNGPTFNYAVEEYDPNQNYLAK